MILVFRNSSDKTEKELSVNCHSSAAICSMGTYKHMEEQKKEGWRWPTAVIRIDVKIQFGVYAQFRAFCKQICIDMPKQTEYH